MIDWINNKYGVNLSENELICIKDFSLLWNVFEKEVCDTRCTINKLKDSLRLIQFEMNDFEVYLEYFQNRYITDNVTNVRFENLHITSIRTKKFVADVLLGKKIETSEIVFALALIVYRYRNNLFHGVKDILVINEQEQNFLIANQTIMSILNYY